MSDKEVLLGDTDEIDLQSDISDHSVEQDIGFNLEDFAGESDVEPVSIDEFLHKTTECGQYQFITVILIMFTMLPMSYIPLIYYYIGHNPPWRCTENINASSNASICLKYNASKVFVRETSERCKLNDLEWEFHNEGRTTMVTDFKLVCDRAWLDALAGSVVFIGWGIGILILGYLSDRYGRKKVMYPAMFITLLTLAAHSFTNDIWQIIVIRFFMGFFYSAPALNSFVLVIEMVGQSKRVLAGIFSNFVWPLGAILMTLKAYFIKNWRYLVLACSIPYILGIFTYICVPESVRWLSVKGKVKDAENILHKAAKYNKKQSSHLSLKSDEVKENTVEKTSYIDLVRGCLMARLIFAQAFIWFNTGMTYYTLSWAFADFGGDFYLNFILSILIEVPGGIVSYFSLKRFGRKKTTIATCFLAGIFAIAIGCTTAGENLKGFRVFSGLTAKFMITMTFCSIYIWSAEILATSIRTQGMGVCIVTSRIGAATSPFVTTLEKFHPSVPFVLLAISSIIAGIVSIALPETLNQPTREVISDMFKEPLSTVRVMYSLADHGVQFKGINRGPLNGIIRETSQYDSNAEDETERLMSSEENMMNEIKA